MQFFTFTVSAFAIFAHAVCLYIMLISLYATISCNNCISVRHTLVGCVVRASGTPESSALPPTSAGYALCTVVWPARPTHVTPRGASMPLAVTWGGLASQTMCTVV